MVVVLLVSAADKGSLWDCRGGVGAEFGLGGGGTMQWSRKHFCFRWPGNLDHVIL